MYLTLYVLPSGLEFAFKGRAAEEMENISPFFSKVGSLLLSKKIDLKSQKDLKRRVITDLPDESLMKNRSVAISFFFGAFFSPFNFALLQPCAVFRR
jgi:hypothetical protein